MPWQIRGFSAAGIPTATQPNPTELNPIVVVLGSILSSRAVEREAISKMMQAAQLAAEAAIQEAVREANSAGGGFMSGRGQQAQQPQHHHNPSHDSSMDMDSSDANIGMDPEQMAFLRAMQAAEMGEHADMANDVNMMGLAGGKSRTGSVQSLLQLLAQQEQENQRPDEHYLTIAQNGEFFSVDWDMRLNSFALI